jgi:sarcosine oxidase subunit beta
MGPGTGKRLAQQILGEHSDISLEAFDIGRFDTARLDETRSSGSHIPRHLPLVAR